MNYYIKSSTKLTSKSTDQSVITTAVQKAYAEGLNYCEFHATGSSAFTNGTQGMAQIIFNTFNLGLRVGYVMPSGTTGKYLVYWTFT